MYKFLFILGAMITLVSAFFVTAATTDLLTESGPDFEILMAVIIFFSLTGIFGLYLTISNLVRHRRKKSEQKQKQVLKVIKAKGGRVMPVEIAAQTNLLIDEAQKILDQLCRMGICRSEMTEGGKPVYIFKAFLPGDEGSEG